MKIKKCKTCGNNYESKGIDPCSGLCLNCCSKRTRSRQTKSTTKRLDKVVPIFERYVKAKIEYELSLKERIHCENCGIFLFDDYQKGLGMMVAHIISSSERKDMYYIRENSIMMCKMCHMTYDRVNPKELRIYEELLAAREVLLDNVEQLKSLPHNKVFYNNEDF